NSLADDAHSRAPSGWLRGLLEDLVGGVEAVGPFEGDGVELQRRDRALDRLGLVDQSVDRRLHGSVALGIAFADLLVVGLAAYGARLDRLHRGNRHVELARQF